jgi:hypothetical protein
MILLQQSLIARIAGGSNPDFSLLAENLTSSADLAVCSRQRARLGVGGGFANVSALGLFLTLALGMLIIVTNLSRNSIMGLVGRFYPIVRVKEKAWIHDDALHLQRLAYMSQERAEGEHGSVWIDTDKEIPRVDGMTLLRPLIEPEVDQIPLEPRSGQQYSKLSASVRYGEDEESPAYSWKNIQRL